MASCWAGVVGPTKPFIFSSWRSAACSSFLYPFCCSVRFLMAVAALPASSLAPASAPLVPSISLRSDPRSADRLLVSPSCLSCLLVSSISLRKRAEAEPADSNVALMFSLAESVTEYFLSVMLFHSQPGQRQLIPAQGSRHPPPLDLLFRCRVDKRHYIYQAFDVCRGK